ncbi:MAG: hypothetical protein ACC652_08320 [Acidimicrobiales bacterium]
MNCPWCTYEGTARQLHAHLGEGHQQMVSVEQRTGEQVYGISCPICGATYEQPIKPRLRDAGFLDEFASEIRLVAFDMLINHLIAEHEQTEIEVPEPGLRPRRST